MQVISQCITNQQRNSKIKKYRKEINMRTINLFSKTVLASSLLMVSAVSLAHNGEDHSAPEKMTVAIF
jgi:hypothetical protein